MKSLVKLIQYIILLIVFSIPLYVAFIVTIGNLASADMTLGISKEVFIALSAIFLFLLASYLALRVMENKFTQSDIKTFPAYVLIILALFIFYSFIVRQLDTVDFLYPLFVYIQVRLFLNKKFKRI